MPALWSQVSYFGTTMRSPLRNEVIMLAPSTLTSVATSWVNNNAVNSGWKRSCHIRFHREVGPVRMEADSVLSVSGRKIYLLNAG